MGNITLAELGITSEDLIGRIVDRLAGELNEDGYYGDRIDASMAAMVTDKINAAVTAIGDETLAAKVKDIVEGVTLQPTNQWGEKKAEPLTFIEYLIKRAETYLVDEVNYDGRSFEEYRRSGSCGSWNKHTTRVVFLVQSHLQNRVKEAMDKALAEANSQIATGIEGAVKMAMENVLKGIKASVVVK
jgi:hypothetical protein